MLGVLPLSFLLLDLDDEADRLTIARLRAGLATRVAGAAWLEIAHTACAGAAQVGPSRRAITARRVRPARRRGARAR